MFHLTQKHLGVLLQELEVVALEIMVWVSQNKVRCLVEEGFSTMFRNMCEYIYVKTNYIIYNMQDIKRNFLIWISNI